MPKGGARINSGPPPDPNALRRDRKADAAGWVTLPADGRAGDPPAWPLPEGDQHDAELALWADIWRTPQAVMWERLRWTREVALYVRLQVLAESGSLDAAKESRQWSDRLGLNPAAMLRNRWRVESAPSAPADEQERPSRRASGRRSARARLQAIDGGKASE